MAPLSSLSILPAARRSASLLVLDADRWSFSLETLLLHARAPPCSPPATGPAPAPARRSPSLLAAAAGAAPAPSRRSRRTSPPPVLLRRMGASRLRRPCVGATLKPPPCRLLWRPQRRARRLLMVGCGTTSHVRRGSARSPQDPEEPSADLPRLLNNNQLMHSSVFTDRSSDLYLAWSVLTAHDSC
jgi:hypothetical protein